MKFYKAIFIIYWMCIGVAFGQNEVKKQQKPDETFIYTDCGCGGSIELTIYNGLYGSYGGQEVADADEETKGAVTVANKNDTDGDTLVDFQDNEVVSGPNGNGRDEVDLMKLVVRKFGKFPISCTELLLKIEGKAKLWNYKTKMSEAINTFDIQNMASETILWVEAYETSNTVRDISITAIGKYDNGEGEKEFIFDKVNATAIWVELIPQDVFHVSSPAPIPSALGLDATGLLNTINNNHLVLPLGMLSKNGDRYGFGTFGEGNMPSKPNIDLWFGGKILFRFKLLPIDAFSLGNISLDIARRKKVTDKVYFSTDFGPTITSFGFPSQNEEANDDPQEGGAGDNLDEDKIPDSNGYIFSFDSPSTPNGYNTNLSSPPPPIVIRDLNFEEYVRVSFGTAPVGDVLAGSRCSIKQPWSLNCSNYATTSNDLNQPFNDYKQSYSQANGNMTIITKPRTISMPTPTDGNGIINITALSNNQNTFILQYNLPSHPSIWRLVKLDATGMPIHVAWSTALSSNIWKITSSEVEISISQGTINFSGTNDLIFKVLSIPNSVTNQLNNF